MAESKENITETITVAYIARKDTQTGKMRWNLKSEAGQWYSIWDEAVATQIQPKSTIMVGVQEKNDFKNIVSVIPPGMQESVVAQTATQPANPNPELDEFFGQPSAPTPPPKQTVVDEIRLTVEERMRALDVAALLVAHDKLPVSNMVEFADKALAYYRNSPVLSEQKSSSDKPDAVKEFVK